MWLFAVAACLGLMVWAGVRQTPIRENGDRWRPPVVWTVRRKRKPNARKLVEPGLLVSEVATRLRSGSSTEQAWRQTLARAGLSVGGGAVLDENGVPLALRRLWSQRMWGRGRSRDLLTGLPPAIAVCRMSHATGAPTAQVLDSCAQGITEAADAAAGRRVALAGPKASARMLAWLPLLGLMLGTAIGASPVAFLTGSFIGAACLLFGLGFELLGILWIRRLMARAEKE